MSQLCSPYALVDLSFHHIPLHEQSKPCTGTSRKPGTTAGVQNSAGQVLRPTSCSERFTTNMFCSSSRRKLIFTCTRERCVASQRRHRLLLAVDINLTTPFCDSIPQARGHKPYTKVILSASQVSSPSADHLSIFRRTASSSAVSLMAARRRIPPPSTPSRGVRGGRNDNCRESRSFGSAEGGEDVVQGRIQPESTSAIALGLPMLRQSRVERVRKVLAGCSYFRELFLVVSHLSSIVERQPRSSSFGVCSSLPGGFSNHALPSLPSLSCISLQPPPCRASCRLLPPLFTVRMCRSLASRSLRPPFTSSSRISRIFPHLASHNR